MKLLIQSLRIFIVLTLLTGIAYPLLVTVIVQAAFSSQSEGSLVKVNGKVVGSSLLSYKTENPKYFWPRPSGGDYATVASGASNLGPSSDALKKAIADRVTKFRAANKLDEKTLIPDDMLTASGSGLDPEISPTGARLQIERVAAARTLSADQKQKLTTLVENFSQGPQFGFLGEPRVNVLLLNIALDEIK